MVINNNIPLVSVIISAYNHEKYVQETIKSLIAQTYLNIELIIIDDGSVDLTFEKTIELKKECENRFVRFEAITQENEGTCSNINKLISMSNGEYVYMIASDDLSKPEAIEKEVNFLNNNHNYALVVGDNEIIDSNGKVCYWDQDRNNIYDIKKAVYKTFGKFLEKQMRFKFTTKEFGLYQTLYFNNYIPNGYLIRKSIFEKIHPFTQDAPLEDWFLMLQISKYAKMKYINEILFSYRWHDANTIKQEAKMKEYHDKTRIFEEKILKTINKNEVLGNVIEALEQVVLYKRQGIKYLFELFTYRKNGKKNKIIKIFGMKIFSLNKK